MMSVVLRMARPIIIGENHIFPLFFDNSSSDGTVYVPGIRFPDNRPRDRCMDRPILYIGIGESKEVWCSGCMVPLKGNGFGSIPDASKDID